jgi:tetratricopeptide (TPR) repeat protein
MFDRGMIRLSIRLACLALIFSWAPLLLAQSDDLEKTEEAYRLNEDGMTDMSMAEFESAATKFLYAAAMVPDYGITGRPLRYTPTFMAAWALEKLGRREEACRYFKKFLEIAPTDSREPSKVEHAQEYLGRQCGS